MGWLEIINLQANKTEILGNIEQYKRNEGIPTINKSQEIIDEIDKQGE